MHPIEHLCCQNSHCPEAGLRGHGNLTFRGGSGQGKRLRMVSGRPCKARFSEPKGTGREQARRPDAKILDGLNPIRAGGGTRATGRLVGGDKNTVTRSVAGAPAPAESRHQELGAVSPRTRAVQGDAKGAFVSRQEKSCDPLDPLDRRRGDDWDPTAVDPESRLRLGLVPGKRADAACQPVIQEIPDRTAGRTDWLITSDEHAPY